MPQDFKTQMAYNNGMGQSVVLLGASAFWILLGGLGRDLPNKFQTPQLCGRGNKTASAQPPLAVRSRFTPPPGHTWAHLQSACHDVESRSRERTDPDGLLRALVK